MIYRHQYVVSMYELYETPKCLWIILELVQGGDLTKHLAESPNYSEADASRHMKQVRGYYQHSSFLTLRVVVTEIDTNLFSACYSSH